MSGNGIKRKKRKTGSKVLDLMNEGKVVLGRAGCVLKKRMGIDQSIGAKMWSIKKAGV